MSERSELVTGPTSDGVPWRKVLVAALVIGIGGTWFGFAADAAIDADTEARFDRYRERCAALPADVEAAVAAGLTDLEGRAVRGVGLARATEGDLAGSWFVSLELASPHLARGSAGDIATFVVPDAGGAPATAEVRAVGPDAERFSSWPPAGDGIHLDHDGGIVSRFCAKDDGPAVLRN